MPNAEAVYIETIKPFPRAEQLEIASLILQALRVAEEKVEKVTADSTVSYATIISSPSSDVYHRSPRFAAPADALCFEKHIVSEEEGCVGQSDDLETIVAFDTLLSKGSFVYIPSTRVVRKSGSLPTVEEIERDGG